MIKINKYKVISDLRVSSLLIDLRKMKLREEKAKQGLNYDNKKFKLTDINDLLFTLRDESNEICYLCEQKKPQYVIIEHFSPHLQGKYLNKKYSYANLLYACRYCNSIKSNSFIILDPKKNDYLSINYLSYKYQAIKNGSPIIEIQIKPKRKNILHKKSKDTQELLNIIYNGKQGETPANYIARESIQTLLEKEIDLFFTLLKKYDSNPSNNRYYKKILEMIELSSPFSSFKKYYLLEILSKNSNYKIFKKYIY